MYAVSRLNSPTDSQSTVFCLVLVYAPGSGPPDAGRAAAGTGVAAVHAAPPRPRCSARAPDARSEGVPVQEVLVFFVLHRTL